MEHNDNEQIVKIENIWFQEENLTIESHWRFTKDEIKYKVNFGHRYMMMNKYYASIIKCKVDNTYFILSSPYSNHVLPIPVPNPSKPKTHL